MSEVPPARGESVPQRRIAGEKLHGPVIFHCLHRAFGVGMFDTGAVVAGDRFVAATAARGPANMQVGTVSHCHGALNILSVAA